MLRIKEAKEQDIEVLALLGTITYSESHGQYIHRKSDLMEYLKSSFAIEKLAREVLDVDTIFYIMYSDELPIGYAKIRLHSSYKNLDAQRSLQLERIYILGDYIPLKVGQYFLSYIESKIAELNLDTIWLSVYKENHKAIRFYDRNGYNEIGENTFVVNGSEYDNLVFSKKIEIQVSI